MGQQCAVNSATQRTLLAGRATGAARYIGRVGALAVALGVGAAVASGAGIARADDPVGNDPGGNSAGVQSPAAHSPAGDPTDSVTAGVTPPAGAPHGVKLGKPGLLRLPRMLQSNSGGAHRSSVRRGARSADTTSGAAAAGEPRTPAAAGDDGLAAAAMDPGRLPERLEASIQALLPTGIVGPTAPADGTARTSPRDHAVADSGTDAPARRQNTDRVATRVRVLVQDTATALHQPSRALVDTPPAHSAAALVHTDGSTLNRLTAESVSPTATFTPHLTAAPPERPIATVVSSLLAAVGINPASGVSTGDAPAAPMPLVLGVLQLIRREIDHTFLNEGSAVAPSTVAPRSLVTSAAAVTTTQPNPGVASISPGVAQPGDVVSTAYGNVGIWMLKSNGQIANWGGQTHDGQTLLEPVNVIIIDPTSTSREESIKKLNRAMSAAGFPADAPHSTGYQGIIDGNTYGQQPSGFLQAFSDNGSPQDHGRMFGPAPAANGEGYVWTGAFSTEGSTHQYLSFDMARDDLASRLVSSGAATRLDDVSMGNAGITGDHDGYAVVLQLSAVMPNTPPSATVTQNKPNTSTGTVTGKVTAVDPDKDKLTYAGMTTDKGTVTVTSTGSFTYTPTVAARHAAAAGDNTDTFSITVDDGFGGVISVPVTVNVIPKNSAPSAKATVSKADPVGGTVTGSIAVTDTDGDGVTYSATNPASGSVTVNPDGTFSYNPTEAARQQARVKKAIGTDKLTITVDDGHGGVKTVTVTATIAPTDQAPVTGALDIGAPAASNGAIKGSLAASDPDNDKFSFSGTTKTAKGYVSVSSKGTFTYTPTAAARRAAASDTANEADKTDTFTITVTDSYGATATKTVTVSILGK
jgi:VCBS repeat-containing protein